MKILDTIDTKCAAIGKASVIDEVEKYSEWWIIALGLPETYNTTGEDRVEVLSRTLIGNRLDEHEKTGPLDIVQKSCPFFKSLLIGSLLTYVDIKGRTKEDFWVDNAAYKSLVSSLEPGLWPTDSELNTLAEYRNKIKIDKTISSEERERLMMQFASDNMLVPDNHYGLAFNRLYLGRCLARTKSGLLCMVPETSQIGDMICFVQGGRVPFVLRPGSKDDRYELVGGSYVHGCMDGEISFAEVQPQTIYLE